MSVPPWLRSILIALVLAAAALLVVELFAQARAGAGFQRMWNMWLVHLRDLKAIAYTMLGVVMGVIATNVRSPF